MHRIAILGFFLIFRLENGKMQKKMQEFTLAINENGLHSNIPAELLMHARAREKKCKNK